MSTTRSWPRCATVNQLRTAVKLEPRPEPDPRPEPQPSITKTSDEEFTCWRIKLSAPGRGEVRRGTGSLILMR